MHNNFSHKLNILFINSYLFQSLGNFFVHIVIVILTVFYLFFQFQLLKLKSLSFCKNYILYILYLNQSFFHFLILLFHHFFQNLFMIDKKLNLIIKFMFFSNILCKPIQNLS